MINLTTSNNIQKFETLTHTTRNLFSYEYVMGLLPDGSSRSSHWLSLDSEIYGVSRLVNLLKTKNIFDNTSSDKFNKAITTINSNLDILCNQLKNENISTAKYFEQWKDRYSLDQVSEFNPLFEKINNKLDELEQSLIPISISAGVISLISKNALLYTKLLPIIRHLESVPNQTEENMASSFQYVINDKFFDPIIDELTVLDTISSSRDKIYYLFSIVKNNIRELVEANPAIFNSKFNNHLKKLNDHGRDAENFFEDCKEELFNQFKLFKGEEALPYAERYKNKISSTSVVNFLNNKQDHDDTIVFTIDFSENTKINKILVFRDRTIGYFKDNEYSSIPLGHLHKLHELRYDVLDSLITHELRKKPTVRNLFLNKFKEDVPSAAQIVLTINNYLANEQILKNLNVNLEIFENKSYENIDDDISSYVKYYKADKNIRNILGNKYSHLYEDNKESILSISAELFDLNVTENVLQEFIGKKIASIHDGQQLFTVLKQFKNSLDGFDKESLFIKLDMLNIKPLEVEHDVFVFEVKDYAASKSLGSPSWCIVRDEYYFNDYTSDSDRQYFIYDFNKDSSDIESMVGFTLHTNGTFRAKHYKNDDFIDELPLLNKAQISVLANDNTYKLTPKLKEKLDSYNLNNHTVKTSIKNTI